MLVALHLSVARKMGVPWNLKPLTGSRRLGKREIVADALAVGKPGLSIFLNRIYPAMAIWMEYENTEEVENGSGSHNTGGVQSFASGVAAA
jgi:hypothetical protein